MAFGEGFKHMDSFEQLAEGNYRAKIVKAELKKGAYGDYIQCEVATEGHQNAKPCLFFIKDSPKEGFGSYSKDEVLEMWCKTTTSFFTSFGIIEGDFEPSHWVGKVGDITVQQQKKNPQYNEIVPYKITPKKKAEEKPSSSSEDSEKVPDIF